MKLLMLNVKIFDAIRTIDGFGRDWGLIGHEGPPCMLLGCLAA